jgi:hypothetical protein
MKTPDRRKPGRQQRLEYIELPLRRARLNQPFPRFGSGWAPQVLEGGVTPGQFVGGRAEQQFARTRVELGSNRTDRPGKLTQVK